ncbi:MAG TPA: hypothetical protein P5268_07685 [Candidatus Marinimicrobia bacterium]|nr:hypothetical protein [Candidatus Neomarinimicrobiota bacterium]HRU92895.1 hypothetical protein [Candidatus Neomarinimicrobiota bacterium]
MKSSKKTILIMLHIFWCSLLFTQEIMRTIDITNADRIENVSYSKHYFSVICTKDYTNFTNLYNNKGELLLSKGEYNERKNIELSKAVESMNLFIIQYGGAERYPEILVAFDIATGEKVWETKFFAEVGEISPSENYFITTHVREDNEKSPFRIIDLRDGNFIDFPLEIDSYHATWLDSFRIVIAFNEEKELGDIQSTEEYTKYIELQRDMHYLRRELGGRVPVIELEKNKRYQEIKQQINSLVEKNPLITQEGRKETLRLIVYNVNNRNIERSKYIYTQDGEKITSIHHFETDKNGNIYIVNWLITIEKVYCIKLNSNLDTVWHRQGKEYLNFTKIKYDNRVIFRTYNKGNYYILNQESGSLVSVEEFKISDPSLANIDFTIKNPNYLTLEINPKVKVNYDKSNFIIKGGE